MKKIIISIVSIFSLLSCQKASNTEVVEGDLYFKAIDFRMFNLPDSILVAIENQAKATDVDTLSEQDKQFHRYITYMVDKGLLRKPYVRVKDNEGAKIMIFLNPSDFKKIENYELSSLRARSKKVRIKAKATELDINDFRAYNASEVVSVEEIDGFTESEK